MSRGQWSAVDRKNQRSGIHRLDEKGNYLRKKPPYEFPYQMEWGFRWSWGWKRAQNQLEGIRRALAGLPAPQWPIDIPGNTRARRSRKWRRARRALPPGGNPIDYTLYQINEPSPAADLDD